jgi:hypothetical protein
MNENDSMDEEDLQMEGFPRAMYPALSLGQEFDPSPSEIVYRKGDADHLIQTLTWFRLASLHEREGPYTEDLYRDGNLQDYTHFGSRDAVLKEWMWTKKSALDRMKSSSVPAHSKA